MSYARDLTDEQSALLDPVSNAPGERGPEHAPDLRRVVHAMLYVSHPGCQWRFLLRVVRALDARVVAVPPVVAQRHLGAGPDRAARGGTRGGRPYPGDAHDGGHRHPRPARTRPPTGDVVREHHHLSDRPAPGRLHLDHPASTVTCQLSVGAVARSLPRRGRQPLLARSSRRVRAYRGTPAGAGSGPEGRRNSRRTEAPDRV